MGLTSHFSVQKQGHGEVLQIFPQEKLNYPEKQKLETKLEHQAMRIFVEHIMPKCKISCQMSVSAVPFAKVKDHKSWFKNNMHNQVQHEHVNCG